MRNSACRSLRKSWPRCVGAMRSMSRVIKPRRSASTNRRFDRGHGETGSFVERMHRKPFDEPQRVQHEFERQVARPDLVLFLHGRAAKRLVHVAFPDACSAPGARSSAETTAWYARPRQCRDSRRSASSSGCAGSSCAASHTPTPRSAHNPLTPCARESSPACRRKRRRRERAAGTSRTACSVRASGDTATNAAARRLIAVSISARHSSSVCFGSANIRSRLKLSKFFAAISTA